MLLVDLIKLLLGIQEENGDNLIVTIKSGNHDLMVQEVKVKDANLDSNKYIEIKS